MRPGLFLDCPRLRQTLRTESCRYESLYMCLVSAPKRRQPLGAGEYTRRKPEESSLLAPTLQARGYRCCRPGTSIDPRTACRFEYSSLVCSHFLHWSVSRLNLDSLLFFPYLSVGLFTIS